MTPKQAFMATYKFLEIYYDETADNRLIDLLSGMNPLLWIDGGSADPAIYNDWLEISKKFISDEQIDAKKAFLAMFEFLVFYEKEFDYVPEWLIEDLRGKSHSTPKWLECVAATGEWCETGADHSKQNKGWTEEFRMWGTGHD